MALGKLSVPGRPTIWMTAVQWPIVLAKGAGGGCLDILFLSPFSLWLDIDWAGPRSAIGRPADS